LAKVYFKTFLLGEKGLHIRFLSMRLEKVCQQGTKREEKVLQGMRLTADKEHIAVVLNRPKYAGNIGSAARCAKNMGVERLMVVSDRDYPQEEIRQMSTHLAADVVDSIVYCRDLGEALAGFHYVVGTTARLGLARGPVMSPRDMAEQVIELSRKNDVALLFGPEDTGLTNEDLRYCQSVVSIPTSERFRSLNLSHAVMILCYEISMAEIGVPERFTPKMASSRETEGMYGHIGALLQEIGFLNPENPEYWMMHIRRLFSRMRLSAREVRIIRGICRQLSWYLHHRG
jgi:tRNA/rRNA methyltransferase